MKIELELDDFKHLICDRYYDCECDPVDNKMIADAFADKVAATIADDIWRDSANEYAIRKHTEEQIALRIRENKDFIINKVVENVTEAILRSKAIVEQMPRKSEITGISKEWENYFVELIDKAIAKRFK